MTCDIRHDESAWIDDDVAAAAQDFAARCDELFPDVDFMVELVAPDEEGWLAYVYVYEGDDEEIPIAAFSRQFYDYSSSAFPLLDGEETFEELVLDFARAISPDGEAEPYRG